MTISEEAPMVGANEFDGVDELDEPYDHRFRNRVFAGFGAVLLACIVFFAWFGFQNWKHDQLLKQLPGVTIVQKDATLVDYIVSDKGDEHRLRLAILAAEEMKRPLSAVETEVAGKDKLLSVTYGTSTSVTYDRARELVAYSDSVKISMLIYPGDLLDPKRGVFISRDDPAEVLRYLAVSTRCGSYENAVALETFADIFRTWVRNNAVSLQPSLNCRGRGGGR